MYKVLHIVENFNGQATEKWLFQTFDELQKKGDSVDWTFFCMLSEPGKFSEKVIEKKGRVICSPMRVSKLIPYMKFLRKTIRNGSYDIIHCHQDLMSAISLLATIGLPIRKRIVHVHNTSLDIPTENCFKVMLFRRLFRWICLYLADHIIGVSEEALKAFSQGQVSSQMSVVHCGVDLSAYHDNKRTRYTLRENLGIPDDAVILLFVGRMTKYKNPCFVLDIIEKMPQNYQQVYAIFAGAGPLEEKVRKIAAEKSLSNRVRVLGWQDNIPSIMLSCDLLVWPGLEDVMEGLGLGVVEAQAAGLKVVMSRNVPNEAVIIPELVDILPLVAGPKAWADTVITALGRNTLNKQDSLQKVKNSSFSISKSAKSLISLYDS